jgi:hypothetical protein
MSCSERKKAEWNAVDDDFKIELLDCNGEVVRSWESIGKVKSSENRPGFRFLDKKTHKLIKVNGNVIITQL